MEMENLQAVLAYCSRYSSTVTSNKDEDKPSRSLFDCAVEVMTTSDVQEKARKTRDFVRQWQLKQINCIKDKADELKKLPDSPNRPSNLQIVPMQQMKSGSRKALIHSVLHAESYATDLIWDIVSRYTHLDLPQAFYDDWVRIAGEEADHFESWDVRLKELGSYYGDLPVHEGLWDSALDTKDSLLARLAIVHMVHEARGLDVFPKALARLEKAKDSISIAIIRKNGAEEVTHVQAGVRWFKYLCERDNKDPIATFHAVVRANFSGVLKPPFNKEARAKAGMTEEWYLPLTVAPSN